jgi:small subunit ribosomal protein S20
MGSVTSVGIFAILSYLQMANHYSSLKRVRQTGRWTEMNRRSKARLRHQIRAMRKVVADKDAKAAEALLPKTFSIIDRSAKIGLIKKNTAARYKSKLHIRLKALTGSAQQ